MGRQGPAPLGAGAPSQKPGKESQTNGAGVELLGRFGQAVGLATNNQAEYRALIKGLELAAKHTTGRVDCYSDSQLIVNQLNETLKVNKKLRPLWIRAAGMENDFDKVTYNHLRRTDPRIEAVDTLANEALDETGPDAT